MAAATAAVAGGVAAVVGAGTAVYNSYQQGEQIKDAQRAADDISDLRLQQADDIMNQITGEEAIYQDELAFITKSTEFAEKQLLQGTSKSMELLQEQAIEAIDATFGGAIEGGMGQRARSKIGQTYAENLEDAQEDWNLGMEDIALRDEEAQRQAENRHLEIVGALEAQADELRALAG